MDVNGGSYQQNIIFKKDSSMHFEGSLQEMIIKGMDFKEKFGCHKMAKYGKTIQNKLMMVIYEA